MKNKKTKSKRFNKNKIIDTSILKGKHIGINDAIGALGFLGGGNGMFSGMNLNVGIGQKASITGSSINYSGHEPAAKFATLSDGSKLGLVGKNKGLRFK